MQTIILTCVACGKTEVVEDSKEEKRDHHCSCGEPMVDKRTPGQTTGS